LFWGKLLQNLNPVKINVRGFYTSDTAVHDINQHHAVFSDILNTSEVKKVEMQQLRQE